MKISALTAATTPLSGAELFPIVQSGNTRRVSLNDLLRSIGNGTAAAPALAPGGDPNTGIYFPAADTIGFVEGGVEALRIDSAANVGIGTPSPAARLHVFNTYTNTQDATIVAAGNIPGINIRGNAGGRFSTFLNYSAGDRLSWVVGTGTGAPTLECFQLNLANGNANFDSGVLFVDATNDRVGVGTTGPSTNFEVVANAPILRIRANSAGTAELSLFSAGSADGRLRYGGAATGFTFLIDTTERMRLDHSGNLGLGVTPSAWSGLGAALQVNRLSLITGGTSAVDAYITSNAFWNGTAWTYIGTAAATQYIQNASGDHRWRIAPSGTAGTAITFTQAMTLDASGNLLVGTTFIPAGQRLRIAGGDVGLEGQYLYLVNANASIQLGAAQNSRFTNTDSTNTLDISRTGASSVITLSTAGAERARVKAEGQVRFVPLAAAPTTSVQDGDVYYDSGTNKLRVRAGGAWVDLH